LRWWPVAGRACHAFASILPNSYERVDVKAARAALGPALIRPTGRKKAPMVSGGRAKGQSQALRSSTASSAVEFSKHNIQRSEDRSHVGQHVAASEKVHGLEVRERRRANFALVGTVGAVGDEIYAKLALRRFHGGINFARRNPVTFGIKLKMMDQRFHGALHLGAARRHDLGINKVRRALPIRCAQLANALLHDTHRLAHLLHTNAVAVVTIAVLANRDVEIELRIALVRLRLA